MNDVIGDILATVKFESAVYFEYGFCGNWGMDVPKGNFSQFHLVTRGKCVLKVEKKNFKLERGDIVILPNGVAHQIKSKKNTRCKSGPKVVTKVMNGKDPFAGEHPKTHLICGHYEMDRDISHSIFDNLPEYIIIRSGEYGRADLIHSAFELLVEEMSNKGPGHQTISLKLAEVLFVSIIRHYYTNRDDAGESNIFTDKLIYKSVDLIHKKLAYSWSIESLAREAGMSRTLYIDRFKKAVGMTPMKYITNWRMTKASQLLKSSEIPLSQIGEQIGYQSETSFNRSFKQRYNVSPGKFRKELKTR